MAFVEIESWSVERPTITGRLGDPELPRWLRNGRDLVLRRSIAVYFSLVVHFGLIWFLAFHLGNEGIGTSNMIEDGPITIVDLARSQSDAMARKQEKRSEALTSKVAEFDLTRAASIPAPEWSMTKLRLMARAPTVAATNADIGPAGPSEGKASYDPYAGAAPMRRVAAASSSTPDIVSLSEAEKLGFELNEAQFQALRRILRAVPCDKDCRVSMVVRISSNGTIIDIILEDQRRRNQKIEHLRAHFIHKKLFQTRSDSDEINIRLIF